MLPEAMGSVWMNDAKQNLRTIGHYLRETRQNQGLDLYDVAERLRIRPGYLFAIEEGDLEAIPGVPYALGFVRSYADCLGFDGDEVIVEVKKHMANRSAQIVPPPRREPVQETRWPTGFAVAGSLVAAVIAYGAWVTSESWEKPDVANVGAWPGEVASYLAELVERSNPSVAEEGVVGTEVAANEPVTPSPVPARPRYGEDAVAAPLLPEMLEAPELTGSPADFAQLASLPSLVTTTLPTNVNEALEQTISDPENPDAAEANSATYGAADGSSRITLIANEQSWVQVQSIDQTYRWTRILEAGERYFMPNRRDLALWTGNAGGLSVIIDGRSIGPLGSRGAVMRDVVLLPEELLATAQ